jgi:hypothetical protein
MQKETPNWGSFLAWLGPKLLADLQGDAASQVLCIVTHGNFLETCVLDGQKAGNCESFYRLLPYSTVGGSISFGALQVPRSASDLALQKALEQTPSTRSSFWDEAGSLVLSWKFWAILLAFAALVVMFGLPLSRWAKKGDGEATGLEGVGENGTGETSSD